MIHCDSNWVNACISCKAVTTIYKGYGDNVAFMLQVCAHKQQLADELSQLTGKHKQLQADKEAADTELSTLKPAHSELQQMHEKAKTELQNTKTALQKSQEARVHAEVSKTTGTNHKHWQPSKQLAAAVG